MKTKMMLQAPDELWQKFKIKTMTEHKTLNEKILELIKDYVEAKA